MHSWFWSSCILRGHCKVWPIVGVTVDTYKAWNCIVGVCKYTEQTHIWGHADIASCPYDIRMQLFAVEIMLTSCGAQDRHWDVPYYPVGQDRPVAGGGGGGGGDLWTSHDVLWDTGQAPGCPRLFTVLPGMNMPECQGISFKCSPGDTQTTGVFGQAL